MCVYKSSFLSVHTLVCNEMIGAIGFVRQSVVLATATHPSPPTLVILRRKSTELRLGGFHLRMSSHLPALYLCRKDNKFYTIERIYFSRKHQPTIWHINTVKNQIAEEPFWGWKLKKTPIKWTLLISPVGVISGWKKWIQIFMHNDSPWLQVLHHNYV